MLSATVEMVKHRHMQRAMLYEESKREGDVRGDPSAMQSLSVRFK